MKIDILVRPWKFSLNMGAPGRTDNIDNKMEEDWGKPLNP